MQGIDDVAALNNDNRLLSPPSDPNSGPRARSRRFESGALLRVEGYYKEGSDLRPVYRNWKGGIDTFPEIERGPHPGVPRSKTSSRASSSTIDRKLGSA